MFCNPFTGQVRLKNLEIQTVMVLQAKKWWSIKK